MTSYLPVYFGLAIFIACVFLVAFLLLRVLYPILKRFFTWFWVLKDENDNVSKLLQPSFDYWLFPKVIIPIVVISFVIGYYLTEELLKLFYLFG